MGFLGSFFWVGFLLPALQITVVPIVIFIYIINVMSILHKMCSIKLRLDQWYSCTKMQYKELHGMLGHPVRAAKSLIVSEREDLARTLLFVLRYF